MLESAVVIYFYVFNLHLFNQESPTEISESLFQGGPGHREYFKRLIKNPSLATLPGTTSTMSVSGSLPFTTNLHSGCRDMSELVLEWTAAMEA